MSKLKFKIYTLGCKVNQYDSFDLRKKLIFAGFKLVRRDADMAIINTCCVTQTAIHKCKRMINRVRNKNAKVKIVVMGCWSKVYQDEAEKFGVDMIWGVGDFDGLIKQIKLLFKFHGILSVADAPSRMTGERSRYFIKIQDGCEQFCSYCIIPYTRGKLSSRPIQEVINEVKQAVKAEYREVVLCGIHLGLYGQECKMQNAKCKMDLVKLLNTLIKIKDLGRVRLSSIEVTEVSDELIKLIATSDKICKHLPIPLQSGSDKILKLMNRPYKVKYFKNKIKKIRKLIPGMAITTDVIIGFPSETKKDFLETFKFIKEMRFSRLHVFPFSAHKETPAAKMPDKVSKQEIEQRGKKLRNLGKELEKNFRKKFVGRILEVLVEQEIKEKKAKDTRFPSLLRVPLTKPLATYDHDGYGGQAGHQVSQMPRYIGKTEYYFDVEFSNKDIIGASIKSNFVGPPNLVKSILKVKA